MNIHNANYIGATGLYPIEEIITNTSNNLANYTTNTSNNITSHYNNLLNTTLPTNNIITKKETILGSNYEWDETILEPLNHLSTISQVQDNVLPQQLDEKLYRYYYFNNNILKEAVSKTTPIYSTLDTSYYELYKKYFGYVNNGSGGIDMVLNDTTQSAVNNATINLSILLSVVDISYPFNTINYPYNAYPIFNIKWNGKDTARILFCAREIEGQGGYSQTQLFLRVQYIDRNDIASTSWRNNSSTPSQDDYIIPPEYYDGLSSYHFWSFNLQRDRWYIYLDGNLILTSSIYSTDNFNFGITDLILEDNSLNLNDINNNKYQFADVYYVKRHLTPDEILNLSKYHMSQFNNTLRVYGTLEVDKIICNSIYDYNYTDKQLKELTFKISQTSNLQYELDHKEPLINLPTNKVVLTNTNGKLTTTYTGVNPSFNNMSVSQDTLFNLASDYSENLNPIMTFIGQQFGTDIISWANGFAGLLALGISVVVGFNAMLGIPYAIFTARDAIPKRTVNDYPNGDLSLINTVLNDYSAGQLVISDKYNNSNIIFRRDYQQGFPENVKNINTGSLKIGNVDGYETNCKFQVIGGDTKIADKLIVQKSSAYNDAYIYNTTSKLELQSGIYNDADNNCSITATSINHDYANNLSISADGNIYLQTYDSSSFTPKLTILNNGNIGIGTSTNITNKLQINGTIQSTDCKITSLTPNTVLVVDNDKKIVSSALISKDDLDTLGQSFIDTSNYVDYTCNIIMTDVNQKFVDTSNYVDYTCNIIMTDVNQKFVDTSNYTLDTSNVISNRITGLAVANINGLQDALDAKQASVSASATSIITITNSTLNTLIEKKETKKIYYDGNFEITSNFYCSNLSCKDLKTEGKTVLSNPNAVDEYATINPYLNRLTKYVVFQIDNTGNKVAKDLISSTTYDYNKDYIDYALNVYAGHIQNGVGQLYFYDKYIETNPLDTESFSVSFWFYVPNGMPQPNTLYKYVCEPLRIDQQRFNFLFQDRRRLRLLITRGNYGGNIGTLPEIRLDANFGTFSEPENFLPICEGNLINFTTNYSNPLFITFNAWIDTTIIYGNIYVNGVLVANGQRGKPNTEWRLEKFYFYQYNYTSSSGFLLPYQNFRFWNIYMTYNTIMSANEAIALYRFETNQILNTLEVNGTIKASAINTDTIYIKNKIFTLPSSFNNVSLFAQEQQTGKITTQTPSASVRNLSIDNVIVNSTGNLINNSGNAGFLYYTDNQNTTVANCKSLAISDVVNLQDTLNGKASTSHNHDGTYAPINHNHNGTYAPISHTHEIANINNLSQEFINSSNYTLNTSNSISNRITGLSTVYAPISHTHEIANINNLSQEFINSSNYTLNTSNSISNRITGLSTVYAPISHTHEIANINNLSQEFINSSNYTLNTSNSISNRITGLSTVYAPISHNHDGTYALIGHSHTLANSGLSQEFINSSNYTLNTSNAISNRITNLNLDQRFINTSNYVLNTSNAISNRITNLSISSAWSTTGNNYTTGNVGIGTNTASTTYDLDIQNATTARLRILGTGAQGDAILALRETSDLFGFDLAYIGNTANKFYIRSYTNSATAVNRISIDRDNGQVGIGTTNAVRLLHLHNNATSAQAFIQFTDNTTTASDSRGCVIGKQTNNDMLIYNYQANANIILATATTTGTPVNILTITGAGLVGIGITQPQEELHLHKTTASTEVYTQYTDGTTTASANRGTLIGKTSTQDFHFTNREIGKNFSFNTTPTTQGVIVERLRIENGKTYSFGNAVAICNTTNYGVVNNNMSAGSLTIGDTGVNFGGGTTGWLTNTAGLLMECADNTEIAIHDAGNRLASFMYYEGGATNRFQIGRNMFWGNIGTIALWGNVGIGTATPSTLLDVVGGTPILTLRTTGNADGKIYFGNSGHGVGRNPNLGTLNGVNDVGLWTSSASVGFCIGGTEYGRFNNGGGFLLSTYTGFVNNTWNISRDTINAGHRMYFGNNSSSYWKGYGSATNVFRNGNDGDIGYFSASDLYLNGALYLGYTNDITARAHIVASSATNYWRIICSTVDGGGKDNTGNLLFYGNNYISGFVEDDTGAYDAYNKMNFTGQHRTIADDKTLYSSNYDGYLVSASGKYKALSSKYGRNNIKQNIITNDALPIVELTSKAYDPCVFGVITERTDEEYRQFKTGSFVSLYFKDGGDDRLIVNGCGEGSIWICNINGNLKNGDYLCSSDIAGIAMKQDDDLLHNYTCAKITMDCDFEPKLVPIEIVKNVEYTEYTSNYYSSNYQYFEESTSNMTTQHIDDFVISSRTFTSNILDIEGNPIYEYKLDESSNILYDYEYEVKTVIHNNIEYKMAFVGCTYKMS
jgi:hypothetical protein